MSSQKVFHHRCVRSILGTRHSNGISTEALFGDLRGTRPVGSLPVTLHTLMRKDVLCYPFVIAGVSYRNWYQHGESYMVVL